MNLLRHRYEVWDTASHTMVGTALTPLRAAYVRQAHIRGCVYRGDPYGKQVTVVIKRKGPPRPPRFRSARWCGLFDHAWRLDTTGRNGLLTFERCVRDCGATRVRK